MPHPSLTLRSRFQMWWKMGNKSYYKPSDNAVSVALISTVWGVKYYIIVIGLYPYANNRLSLNYRQALSQWGAECVCQSHLTLLPNDLRFFFAAYLSECVCLCEWVSAYPPTHSLTPTHTQERTKGTLFKISGIFKLNNFKVLHPEMVFKVCPYRRVHVILCMCVHKNMHARV